MTIVQMVHFQTVCKYQNITRAAEKLHISQPSVSNSIIQLEKEFGVKLFLRTKKRLVLTEAGKFFLERVEHLLNLINELETQMRDIGHIKNYIKLGIPCIMSTFLMPSLLNEFCSLFPDLHVEICESSSSHIKQMLLNGMLDVGIITMNTALAAPFTGCLIKKSELMCCVHASHPLAGRKVITARDLCDFPLILPSPEPGAFQKELIFSYLERHGIEGCAPLYSSQVLTTVEYLQDGQHIAFLYKEHLDYFPEIRFIHMDERFVVQIGLIWRKDSLLYSDIKKLIQYMKEVFIPSNSNRHLNSSPSNRSNEIGKIPSDAAFHQGGGVSQEQVEQYARNCADEAIPPKEHVP